MIKKKQETIKCPHCGYEYLAGELFIPKSFLGQPSDILRDDNGKILDFIGVEQDPETTYFCDKCNGEFRVQAKFQYYTVATKTSNFDEEYSSQLHKDSILLTED